MQCIVMCMCECVSVCVCVCVCVYVCVCVCVYVLSRCLSQVTLYISISEFLTFNTLLKML
jgi:uncharacterized membrane protein